MMKFSTICCGKHAVLIEALYTIPLTPASDGWRAGFKLTTKPYAEDRGKSCYFILFTSTS